MNKPLNQKWLLFLVAGYQCVYFRELPRVFQPQSFLHHPLLLWTTPPVQVAKMKVLTPVDLCDLCCVLVKQCFDFSLISFREPGVWALERAKQNVLENYLLVGILEELEDVLLLLERLLPHYFSGVLNIYKTPGGCFLYGWLKYCSRDWRSLICFWCLWFCL